MKYLIKGLNCSICKNDLIKHKSQIKGLSKIYSSSDDLVLETSDGLNSSEILKEIIDHLKHIGHNHNIEIYDEYTIYLKGLTCANCAQKIESETKKLFGVKDANFDFSTEKFNISMVAGTSRNNVFNSVDDVVRRLEPGVEVLETLDEVKKKKSLGILQYKDQLIKFLVVFLGLIINTKLDINNTLKFSVYIILYLIVGFDVLKSAFKNILNGEVFDEQFLMSIASIGAIVVGEYPEAVAVMLFYEIGEMFEDIALERSRDSISAALTLKPDYANLLVGEEVVSVDPKEVEIGDIIFIRPGEKVPLDGIVLSGSGLVDTSAITGESVPVYLEEGQKIISGSVNKDSLLKVKVESTYDNTTIAKIIDLVENANARKAPIEKFITKFAKVYTPIVVLLAVLLTTIPPIFGILEFKDALFRACTFLVISCPCALVISVPLSMFAGIGSASKYGIFVKGGNYLEALSELSDVVFDKTGTITKGVFEVTEINPTGNLSKNELLRLAAIGEQNSTHPIARAIVSNAHNLDINEETVEFTEIAGKGVSYKLKNQLILVGNKKLLIDNNIDVTSESKVIGVKVYVAKDSEYLGEIVVSDKLKDNIKEDLRNLESEGIRLTMLSGDTEDNVTEVAKEVGIKNYYGGLLPTDKVNKLEEMLKTSKEKVAFVGDGVNDAPVLAMADVGIAMGSIGSDYAIEASDVVLMTDEISKISQGIKISKGTKKIIYQNIIFALGVKFIILILGALGIATMWAAVFADVGVTVIAVINSMRALKIRA
ncbi:heavy metal translocating P-type ATPase [Anaerosphaera multitolerans]|uniref:Cd(2+)-exporting ATPase n=1 Tax=Anaerosphaera multitolerans TaxID=2487351 RepID=A0A437S8G3_9FIRM|nr:heavy metal translocating P-type ATPase [Anaerosphaera multitolerans]RVU55373.1 cadmium-translocating P-type ATPase [Anaerosphaera multitolerans]